VRVPCLMQWGALMRGSVWLTGMFDCTGLMTRDNLSIIIRPTLLRVVIHWNVRSNSIILSLHLRISWSDKRSWHSYFRGLIASTEAMQCFYNIIMLKIKVDEIKCVIKGTFHWFILFGFPWFRIRVLWGLGFIWPTIFLKIDKIYSI